MALQQATPENALKDALTAFETSLATPVISGELADWLQGVQESWTEASEQIHFSVKHTHPRHLEEIGSADSDLLPRIEQLQAEDAAIEHDRDEFATAMKRSTQHIPKLEPDEGKAQQHTKKLVDQGVALITRVRKQEVAIETWFVEAFNRDRGAGD